MKRRMKVLMLVLCLCLCAGCGKAEESGKETADTTDETLVSGADETQPAGEAESTATPEPTNTPTPTPEPVWEPAEAPAVRNSLTAEEKESRQMAIIEKGQFLFSGSTDESFETEDLAWLHEADAQDSLILRYACDAPDHGGWGVLGWRGTVDGNWVEAGDVNARSAPEVEGDVIITGGQLCGMYGIGNASELQKLHIGAWNGGRIAALYFATADIVAELEACVAEIEEYEQIIHTYTGELSNENSIESAVILYQYLKDVYGTACLTGQMESTWMGTPDYEMNYIENNTGKLPAIRGLDFMHNDFQGVVDRSIEWWNKGGIVTICWHTGAGFNSGYDESLADDINWEEAFVPGSQTYNSLVAGMDRAVPYLQQLEDEGVPVLWRPFHELDGGWFWWSKGGSENFIKLWQLMYSRYTDYWGLDNLIWVYGYSQSGGNCAAWYPGDTYVDLVGADSYQVGARPDLWEGCVASAPEGMPLVFHECGVIPTEQEMKDAGATWLFFMVWHTSWITDTSQNSVESLNEIYNSDYFITLDELPDFATYPN